jgi:pilus assembly protein CpaB
MNKNILIVLAGGFLIAIMVALMVQAALKGSKQEAEPVARTEVLVAAKNLAVGHELRSGDLKWQTWPEDALFPGAVIRDADQPPTDAIHGKLLRSMVEGQPVHINVVAEDDKGDFLSANVKKGMRAVGVAVKAHVLADRLIRPGDFVDVIVTYRVRVNTRTNPEAQSLVNRYASETVIENVRILAVDNNDTKAVDEEEEDGKKKRKKSSKNATVTLEVSPDQSEKLVLADKMGDIGLALRSIGDNSSPESDRTTTDVGMSRVMTNLSSMNGTSSAVRIYNGDQMREVEARNVLPVGGIDFSVEDRPVANQTIYLDPAALGGIGNEE